MSELVIVAIVAAIPPTLAAITGVVIGILNNRKANEIHVLVNSNLTTVKEALATALTRIATLETLLSELSVHDHV